MIDAELSNKIRQYKPERVKVAFDSARLSEIAAAVLPPAIGLGAVGVLLGVLFDKKHGIYSSLAATLGAIGAIAGAGLGAYSMGTELKVTPSDTPDAGKEDNLLRDVAGGVESTVGGLAEFASRILPGSGRSMLAEGAKGVGEFASSVHPYLMTGLSGIAGGVGAASKPIWGRRFNVEVPQLKDVKVPSSLRHVYFATGRVSELDRALASVERALQRQASSLARLGDITRLLKFRDEIVERGVRAGVLPPRSLSRLRITHRNVLRGAARGAGIGSIVSLIAHILAGPREE